MICPAKCLLVWAVALTSSLAQSPALRKQFDVAAVKLNTSDDRHFEFHNLPGGTLKATGVTLKMLLMRVYGLQSYQVSGGPGCITMARWDIRAQAEGEPGRSETREARVYALLAAKNGPRLNPATVGSPGVQMRPASKLHWAQEPGQGSPEAFGLPPVASDASPADTNGPSIFNALQEQLGLRLESQKGPVEILVIDHVEKASDN